jgi:RNA polymerase sigma factor (sigma-70 family)
MEATSIKTAGHAGLRGPTPLLRLASDERLVALTRKGHAAAFEALVARYQSRLLAFCRHMLSSKEDAEDVLQEVFAAAFNAMIADERPINVRPWLYRIARNRSLNHLRKATAVGVDSMDIHMAEHGVTTAEKAHKREEFRLLMADVETLPETQRTALLLREIDALSYEQIAEAMDTTIPSVKSLLVRARVSLAEAAEARTLSCADVRAELGEVAEGIKHRMSPPVRRHVRTCDRCKTFRKQLRDTNKALAALFPIGPLLFFKKSLLAHLGTTASAGGAVAGATSTAAVGTASAGGASALAGGMSVVASKTVAGLTAAAIVTAGAYEVQHSTTRKKAPQPVVAQTVAPAPAPVEPEIVASVPQPDAALETAPPVKARTAAKHEAEPKPEVAAAVTTPAEAPAPETTTVPEPVPAPAEGSDTTTLPPQEQPTDTGQPAPEPQNPDGQTTTPTPTPEPAPAESSEQPPPPAEDTQAEQPPPPTETLPLVPTVVP